MTGSGAEPSSVLPVPPPDLHNETELRELLEKCVSEGYELLAPTLPAELRWRFVTCPRCGNGMLEIWASIVHVESTAYDVRAKCRCGFTAYAIVDG